MSTEPTPRTDAAEVKRYVPFGQVGSQEQLMVHANFARGLEREAAKMKHMLFQLAYKLNVVLGLNKEELAFLESIGATVVRPTEQPPT